MHVSPNASTDPSRVTEQDPSAKSRPTAVTGSPGGPDADVSPTRGVACAVAGTTSPTTTQAATTMVAARGRARPLD